MLIVVPDDNPPVLAGTPALERLRTIGEVRLYDSDATDPKTLIDRLREADVALNIRGRTLFTAEALEACPKLKLISIWGTGTDNVDLPAAAARGVTVTNTPGADAVAVAEHTVALMLAAAKQLASADQAMRQGGWPRNLVPQLRGKRLGLVGTGLIGREVAAMAKGARAWRWWPGHFTRAPGWPTRWASATSSSTSCCGRRTSSRSICAPPRDAPLPHPGAAGDAEARRYSW